MRKLLLVLTILCFLLSPIQNSHANLFGDILDKAKQAAEQVVTETIGGKTDKANPTPQQNPPPPAPAEQPVSKPSPLTDQVLVKQIQTRLNQLGYNAGTPDGLYGLGTRKAIVAYQQSQNLRVDGQPSEALLASLNATREADSAPQKLAAETSLPEPTPATAMLAAVHYRPYLLDDEFSLKRVVLTVHPELQSVVSNEFQWHKRKAGLKTQLREEAKAAQLSFELQPWRESSTTKGQPVELIKYDFSRQAFQVRFATGTARQVTPKMLLPGGGEPAEKYEQQINWFAVAPDQAEQIDSYFGNRQRRAYLHYRLRATGALINASRPTPVMEFVDDQLDLYAIESTPQGNTMQTEYKFLARVKLPTTASAAALPVVSPSVVVTPSGSAEGIVQHAEIDGIKLGMPVDAALQLLRERGYKMEQPSQFSKLTGVTIHGQSEETDGSGWIKIMLRQRNGVVYQYQKEVTYMLNKLPAGTSAADLEQRYHTEFTGKFSGARYSHAAPNGWQHFDDSTPPPYNRKVTSPHALVLVGVIKRSGRFMATVNLTWQELVGLSW